MFVHLHRPLGSISCATSEKDRKGGTYKLSIAHCLVGQSSKQCSPRKAVSLQPISRGETLLLRAESSTQPDPAPWLFYPTRSLSLGSSTQPVSAPWLFYPTRPLPLGSPARASQLDSSNHSLEAWTAASHGVWTHLPLLCLR